MNKIMIIDGGPRKTFNTASMLQKFAEGAASVCDQLTEQREPSNSLESLSRDRSRHSQIEIKTVRLYDLDYKGCMSCMACKIRGKVSNVCKFKDALTPVLQEVAEADGLVLGSPIYFGQITGLMQAFLERLAFPWLSYNDYSLTALKKMPVVLIETMNGTPERNNSQSYGSMEYCITQALGEPEKLIAYNTYQVKNYDNYELRGFSEPDKRKYREEHWEEDLQKAFDAGKRMAEFVQTSNR